MHQLGSGGYMQFRKVKRVCLARFLLCRVEEWLNYGENRVK